ncbi:MAG: hypothetical protein RIC35_24705 [Marinoscillum sp.]
MENIFKPGDVVFAKNLPHIKLIVRRFEDEYYYCKVHNHPDNVEQFHYERDLIGSSNPADKNPYRDF